MIKKINLAKEVKAGSPLGNGGPGQFQRSPNSWTSSKTSIFSRGNGGTLAGWLPSTISTWGQQRLGSDQSAENDGRFRVLAFHPRSGQESKHVFSPRSCSKKTAGDWTFVIVTDRQEFRRSNLQDLLPRAALPREGSRRIRRASEAILWRENYRNVFTLKIPAPRGGEISLALRLVERHREL